VEECFFMRSRLRNWPPPVVEACYSGDGSA
jgi:hypothetical protein